jgi:Ca-activated chloride channel family protein
MQVEIDEGLLRDIAKITGGQYFRATSTTKLSEIYDEINKLEKTDIEEFKYTNYDEMFRPWVLFALGMLGIETLLRFTLFRSFV